MGNNYRCTTTTKDSEWDTSLGHIHAALRGLITVGFQFLSNIPNGNEIPLRADFDNSPRAELPVEKEKD
jgi:hypothetical protein